MTDETKPQAQFICASCGDSFITDEDHSGDICPKCHEVVSGEVPRTALGRLHVLLERVAQSNGITVNVPADDLRAVLMMYAEAEEAETKLVAALDGYATRSSAAEKRAKEAWATTDEVIALRLECDRAKHKLIEQTRSVGWQRLHTLRAGLAESVRLIKKIGRMDIHQMPSNELLRDYRRFIDAAHELLRRA